MELIEEMGATVEYSDPHVPKLEFPGRRRKSVPLTAASLRRFQCAVIATAHHAFDWGLVLRHARSIVDTRNALRGSRSPKIVRL